jgi:hypothetical protein
MPVTRYRSVSEMPRPPRAEASELTRRIRSLWRRVLTMAPKDVPRGVQRFRTIEEAQAARAAAERRRLRRP